MIRGFSLSIRPYFVATILMFAGVSSLNSQATLASAKPPGYPLAAKAAGIDGPVVVKALISKEGKVENLRVISGPPELWQAALDAVSKWTYHPSRHFGRLVEVDTTITINFDMGTGKKKLEEQAKAQAELAKAAQPTASQEPIASPDPKH